MRCMGAVSDQISRPETINSSSSSKSKSKSKNDKNDKNNKNNEIKPDEEKRIIIKVTLTQFWPDRQSQRDQCCSWVELLGSSAKGCAQACASG